MNKEDKSLSDKIKDYSNKEGSHATADGYAEIAETHFQEERDFMAELIQKFIKEFIQRIEKEYGIKIDEKTNKEIFSMAVLRGKGE